MSELPISKTSNHPLSVVKPRTNRLFPQAGPNRGIGRSTALALQAIAQAILNPNQWLLIRDHNPSRDSDKALMFMCKELTTDMELKHFSFEWKAVTGQARIRCDIFGE